MFALAGALVFLVADSVSLLLVGRVLSGLSAGVFTGLFTATAPSMLTTIIGIGNHAVTGLIPGMFGVAYRRGLLHRATTLPAALPLLAANVALVTFGPYSLSLVGIEGQRLTNMSPPSLLLAGHAIVMCCLIIAAIPAIERWARHPRVWWLTAIGNSGAMTLYLWHMPALLGVHLLFDVTGHPRYPGRPDFLAVSLAQLLIMAALVAALFVALRPLENNALPGWDGPVVVSGARGVGVGMLLCVAGIATLASVKWGLKDDGLYCIAALVVALIGARVLSVDVRRPPPVGGSHSAARLPEQRAG